MIGVFLNTVLSITQLHFDTKGVMFALLAMCSYALFAVIYTKLDMFTTGQKTFEIMKDGMISFFLIAFIINVFQSTLIDFCLIPLEGIRNFLFLMFQGVLFTGFVYYTNNKALEYLGANANTTFFGLTTVITVGLGIVVFNEIPTLYSLLTTLLILFGIIISNIETNSG